MSQPLRIAKTRIDIGIWPVLSSAGREGDGMGGNLDENDGFIDAPLSINKKRIYHVYRLTGL